MFCDKSSFGGLFSDSPWHRMWLPLVSSNSAVWSAPWSTSLKIAPPTRPFNFSGPPSCVLAFWMFWRIFRVRISFLSFFDRSWPLCLVMVLPIVMLWGVQMQARRKLALGGIFSLVIITIAFAIIRTVAVTTLTRLPDTSWLYMWSAIETTVGKNMTSPVKPSATYFLDWR